MRHFRDPQFQPLYDALPKEIRDLADRNFALLKSDPKHPSLHFKRLRGDVWSARVGRKYRALAIEGPDCFQWFWIGTHAEYDRWLVNSEGTPRSPGPEGVAFASGDDNWARYPSTPNACTRPQSRNPKLLSSYDRRAARFSRFQ